MNLPGMHFSQSGRAPRLAFDGVLIMCVTGLLLIGLIMLTSASISISAREHAEPFAFLFKQLLFAGVGGALALVVFLVRSDFWDRASLVLLIVGFALLI